MAEIWYADGTTLKVNGFVVAAFNDVERAEEVARKMNITIPDPNEYQGHICQLCGRTHADVGMVGKIELAGTTANCPAGVPMEKRPIPSETDCDLWVPMPHDAKDSPTPGPDVPTIDCPKCDYRLERDKLPGCCPGCGMRLTT